eukprot:1143665-Pelagomonas_calceolata.AAC.2
MRCFVETPPLQHPLLRCGSVLRCPSFAKFAVHLVDVLVKHAVSELIMANSYTNAEGKLAFFMYATLC